MQPVHIYIKNIPVGNIIHVNNKIKALDKVTSTEFYWHIIEIQRHKLSNITKWCNHYQDFKNASENTWSGSLKYLLMY